MAASVRPSCSGYEKLKARHKQAYTHLSKALQIDEAGVGKPGTVVAGMWSLCIYVEGSGLWWGIELIEPSCVLSVTFSATYNPDTLGQAESVLISRVVM